MDVNVNWVMGEIVLTLRFPVGLSVKVPYSVPDLGMPVRTTVA